jgi:O-acetyl-ADP-ribose deacetylase (regulator of RNase III)
MPTIVLTALDQALAEAWQHYCGRYAFVSVERRSILEVDADALVSPANSFGFMDGGIDLVYSEFFGWEIQGAVQEMIRTEHHGELPVGVAGLVETGSARFPYLFVAPTMRVPQTLKNSPNAFLAARAVLLLLVHGQFKQGRLAGEPIAKHIRRVAFPGLGTGVGALPAAICARQFAAAIESVLIGSVPFPTSCGQAHERNYELVRP